MRKHWKNLQAEKLILMYFWQLLNDAKARRICKIIRTPRSYAKSEKRNTYKKHKRSREFSASSMSVKTEKDHPVVHTVVES